MIRSIKALGLAFLAIAVVGALVASVAQGATDTAVITGQNTAGTAHQLNIGGTTVECKTATLEGTVKQTTHASQLTATQLEVTPTYQECQGFGGIPVTVQTHGCRFTVVGTALGQLPSSNITSSNWLTSANAVGTTENSSPCQGRLETHPPEA